MVEEVGSPRPNPMAGSTVIDGPDSPAKPPPLRRDTLSRAPLPKNEQKSFLRWLWDKFVGWIEWIIWDWPRNRALKEVEGLANKSELSWGDIESGAKTANRYLDDQEIQAAFRRIRLPDHAAWDRLRNLEGVLDMSKPESAIRIAQFELAWESFQHSEDKSRAAACISNEDDKRAFLNSRS